MKLSELIDRFRDESDDDVSDSYTWSDETVIALLNEAVEEACKRKQLLFDLSTTAICEVAVITGTAGYPLHTAIDFITKAYLVDSDGMVIAYLDLTDRDIMDSDYPYWREYDADTPYLLVVDDTSMQLVPEPSADCTLKLEVYRVPLDTEQMKSSTLLLPPIIAASHHRYLPHWALSVAYNKRNMDKYDPQRSKDHLQKFEDYFGGPVDAHRYKKGRTSRPHRNRLW